ncbi:MAG: HAD-IIIC family phosphatase [Planctomycetota bacterium]|nr:HAD-IIIC family phosphatase [Planctomycetota bacterium]
MDASADRQRGDQLCRDGRYAEAIEAYRKAAEGQEIPPADVCLKIARCHQHLGEHEHACRLLTRLVDAADTFTPWQAAAGLLEKIRASHEPPAKRRPRVALLGSYTTTQFAGMLRLAALRFGMAIDLYEAGFAQYRQEILDPGSGLYAFDPDFVILALHAGEAALPEYSRAPDDDVQAELERWRSLWRTLAKHGSARLIMHNFALPAESPMGHLAARLPGARLSMMHALNARLGEAAGGEVSIIDCERLSSLYGKRRWFDDRYWYLSRQAMTLDALPMLARHTAAVVAADLGLSRKCLVLDLDNTLWGGVIGEDGLSGIGLGAGPAGEAFVAFQHYVRLLKDRGVILAVCSKNNEADAREPFEKHPDMALSLEDIAMFVANWKPKSENIAHIASTLNIGLDALVFVDDNPAEREVIRQMLPEVEVITLPADPSGYVRAVDQSLLFEPASFTEEDAKKTEQYRARAEIARLEGESDSLEDFYASLQMKAVIAPFDALHLPRIVQLIGKTNQFNLTTRRHTLPQIQAFMNDADCVHLYLKLRDRFTDHGLVGLVIAKKDGEVLDIDTLLMSCRVIGRTAERAMMSELCKGARRLGCAAIRGTYVPSAKNAMVEGLFADLGFEPEGDAAADGERRWLYDLAGRGAIENRFIEVVSGDEEQAHDAA